MVFVARGPAMLETTLQNIEANVALDDVVDWLGFNKRAGTDGYFAALRKERERIFERARD